MCNKTNIFNTYNIKNVAFKEEENNNIKALVIFKDNTRKKYSFNTKRNYVSKFLNSLKELYLEN